MKNFNDFLGHSSSVSPHEVSRCSSEIEYEPRCLSPLDLSKGLMASKKQKLGSKRNQKIEGPSHEKLFNESVAKKFDLISTNRSFIKEKGFHHL